MTVLPEFDGLRALVVGFGLEGADLVRFLCERGARVTVSDLRPPGRLQRSFEACAGCRYDAVLGQQPAPLADAADAVFVSQGVPLDIPLLRRARERGLPFLAQTALFFDLCPGRLVGITGSSGKTTTTSLVGAMLAAAGVPHEVGGNIGRPLLARLDAITPETAVVLEVSHTQLLFTQRSPALACVTNVTPNHLDRFTWAEYTALKQHLLDYQSPADVAVLNADDPASRERLATAARVRHFSLRSGDADAWLADGRCFLRSVPPHGRGPAGVAELLSAREIPLRGAHNVANVLAAALVADSLGAPPETIAAAVRAFPGVPHRLEVVLQRHGVVWVNDSIATTPERTLAAIRAFDEPLVLLLGGREKHLPLETLVEAAGRRARAVVTFGEAGPLLAAALRDGAPRVRVVETADLAAATAAAAEAAQEGDVVVLSPACTSFDAYDNFELRGEHFRALVRELTEAPAR